MSEKSQTIEDYVFAWNSNDKKARISLMAKVLAEDCLYFDSHLPEAINGITLHCQFIDRFRDKFPDLSLKLIDSPNNHHGYFKFSWQMLKADGAIFIQGDFFGEINQHNKITKLVGFVNEAG